MKEQSSIKAPTPVSIVVEGLSDVQILRSLLNERQLKDARFFAAQGNLSVASLARNILVHEATPVVVVVDSDGADAAQVQSEQSSALASISPASRYSVFAFDPSLHEVMIDAGVAPNDPISEEMKCELRRHPQIDTFLKRLAQLQPSGEEGEGAATAPPHAMQTEAS